MLQSSGPNQQISAATALTLWFVPLRVWHTDIQLRSESPRSITPQSRIETATLHHRSQITEQRRHHGGALRVTM